MKKVLIALFVFSFSLTGFSQTGISISVTPSIDTCDMGTNLLYSLIFINNDSAAFNGSIAAKATVNGFPHADLITGSPLLIGGDTFTTFTGLYLPVNVSSSFWIGDNVVVIWPVSMIAADTTVGDTVQKHVKVNAPDGINDPLLNKKLFVSAFGNNQFQIHNLSQSLIVQSSIYDLSGRLVNLYSGDKKIIQLINFSSGIYLLEIKLADGKKGMFKILVE